MSRALFRGQLVIKMIGNAATLDFSGGRFAPRNLKEKVKFEFA